MKVGISQNDQKENCSIFRDLHGYIRVIKNGVRIWELQIFKVYKTSSRAHTRGVHFDTLTRDDTYDVAPWEEDTCQHLGGLRATCVVHTAWSTSQNPL